MINWGVVRMGKERRYFFIVNGTEIPRKKDCLNNTTVKNCCAYRTGEVISAHHNTDSKLRGHISIKIFGIILFCAGCFFKLFSAYACGEGSAEGCFHKQRKHIE